MGNPTCSLRLIPSPRHECDLGVLVLRRQFADTPIAGLQQAVWKDAATFSQISDDNMSKLRLPSTDHGNSCGQPKKNLHPQVIAGSVVIS